MIASVVATVITTPGGLGTFEASCVAVLTLFRVPVAATLLLRGFTYWLPMLPGLWWSRREMAEDSPSAPAPSSSYAPSRNRE